MPKNNSSINNSLFDLLKGKGYSPTMLSTAGKEIPTPDEAEVFQFNFVKDGEDYGKVTLTIDDSSNLIVYYSDDVADSEKETSGSGDLSWYGLLNQLKRFAQRYQLSFELRNTDNLKSDMAKRDYMKKQDQIAESKHNSMAEGYSLKKTNVEKTFDPGDPDEYTQDVNTTYTDYEIINNKTGQVVGTANWTTNDFMGPGALKITMKNGATRWLDIWEREKGNPQTAFNRFVKDPKTAKKYKEQDIKDVTEMDKSQTPSGRDGRVSHRTYGSRDTSGDTGAERTAKPITAKQATTDAMGILNKQLKKKDVKEMDNRTPSGDRREQRANSPEEKAKREKEQQANLKKVSPEMRKKLRLPDPDKEDVAEGLNDTQKKIEDTINKLEDRLKHAKSDEQWDRISARIERLQAGLKRSKQGVAEDSEEKDPVWNKGTPMPKDYTCHCGIAVHPSVRNPKAIHTPDCPYAKKQDVAEGQTGVSVKKWAEQVRQEHGADTKFWNDKTHDRVIARKDKEIVGSYDRKANNGTVFSPDSIKEGTDDSTQVLSNIVANEDFDALYDLMSANTEAGKIVQRMYNDVAGEEGLHPDDDFEQILNRVFDHLTQDYGQQGVAEGAPELLKAEMPLVRHIEQELAQNGVQKDDPEYNEKFKHAMAYYRKFGNIDAINKDVAEGLEDSNIQDAIIDTVERLFYKNDIQDYGSLEAIRQGVKHHFSKSGATAESAIEGILNILNKRMRKSGNYVDLGRFKEALRQGVAHQVKKQGMAEEATKKLSKGAKVYHTLHGTGTVVDFSTGPGASHWVDVKFIKDGHKGKITRVDRKQLKLAKVESVAEGDDRGDYRKTAREANAASRLAKSSKTHAEAARLHNLAATYALSAGQDQSVIRDHQMAAHEHNQTAKKYKKDMTESNQHVNESYYPMGKQGSYSDAVPTTKIIIQHSRRIEEGEQRYRNIAKIFVENSEGERFAVPTNKPGLARVYARHIAEGGTPYDERGRHITSLVEEYSKMSGFMRATRGKQFNESAQQLVTEAVNYYQSLRESLSKMTGHRGYSAYFENWTPALMEDGEEQETNLNELFVQETLDPRIESVMPILGKLQRKLGTIQEVDALAEWADNIIEGDGGQEALNPQGIPEAAGPETLAHNIRTDRSNLKAFDLEETTDVTDDNPKSQGGTRAELLRKYANTKKPKDAEAARRAGASQSELKAAADSTEEIHEGASSQDLQNAILYRVEMRHPELFSKYGHEYVADKALDVASFYAGAEEIGSSDMSAMVNHLVDTLKREGENGLDENLDADQKRVGQLGPTEKVGPQGAVGKLVGANESVNESEDELARLLQMVKHKR